MKANIQTGTVSHGTLRTADLLHAFARELERIRPHDGNAQDLVREAFAAVERIGVESINETETDSELVEELVDALNEAAPSGFYFGTLDGDASDYGWWRDENGRRADAADELARSLERRTRDSGESFIALRDGAPQWMTDAVFAAHGNGDMLPNDWSYRLFAAIAEDIAERLRDDCEADPGDARGEIIDAAIPAYNSDRADWLASHLYRGGFCDEALEIMGGMLDHADGIYSIIAAGIALECEQIYSAIVDALNKESE